MNINKIAVTSLKILFCFSLQNFEWGGVYKKKWIVNPKENYSLNDVTKPRFSAAGKIRLIETTSQHLTTKPRELVCLLLWKFCTPK